MHRQSRSAQSWSIPQPRLQGSICRQSHPRRKPRRSLARLPVWPLSIHKHAPEPVGNLFKKEKDYRQTYHVSGEHNLAAAEVLVQVGACERAGVVLVDNLLSVLWRKLIELFGELGARSEDRCAIGSVVHDMDNLSVAIAVLLQQRGNNLARGGSVGALQLALGVFVLSIDDDEGAVRNAGC
jgi:hypothetical protein